MKATVYLHSTKESMRDKGEQLGLKGPALENFMYACYEVEIELEVDEATGNAKIVAVDQRAVAPKI